MTMILNRLVLNNIIIESRDSDHFINATQLCKANNKLFGNWIDQKSSKELIKALEETLKNELEMSTQMNNNLENSNIGILILERSAQIHNKSKLTKVKVIDIKVGGNHSGSWIHPDLAIPLAQWVSPPFSIQVTKWIRELLITGRVSIESQKTNQELIELTKQLAIKDKQLEISQSKQLDLKSEIKNMETFQEDGYIYLTTTKQYSQYNVFRLGRTINLNQRMRYYELGRVQDDKFYYVYIYKSANHELLEHILRRFLRKYMEDSESNKDMYVLPFNILQPFVEKICKTFNENMIATANDMIESNIDFIDNKKPNDIAPFIEPFLYSRSKNDIDDYNEFMNLQPLYYEDMVNKYSIYHGIEILTPKEEIYNMHCEVDIKCPHSRRQVQVRTLLNSLGCNDCFKDKKLAEKTAELYTEKLSNFDDYEVIEIMEIHDSMKGFDRIRIKMQNRVIEKLQTENIALVSEYTNSDNTFYYLCSYGHKNTTTWGALGKKKNKFCRTCSGLDTVIEQSKKTKQITDQELIELADSFGWTHIERTNKSGVYKWECPNGHFVTKVVRELKRAYCANCNEIKKKKNK
jgi:hypothetical protein